VCHRKLDDCIALWRYKYIWGSLLGILVLVGYTDAGDQTSKGGARGEQTLREDVHELRCHGHMQNADITDGHAFLHKVEVDLNMLHALVLNGVGGEVDSADVVTIDEDALRQRSVELLK
jgi:hypothetical protein